MARAGTCVYSSHVCRFSARSGRGPKAVLALRTKASGSGYETFGYDRIAALQIDPAQLSAVNISQRSVLGPISANQAYFVDRTAQAAAAVNIPATQLGNWVFNMTDLCVVSFCVSADQGGACRVWPDVNVAKQ
jgi:hypothetical protein